MVMGQQVGRLRGLSWLAGALMRKVSFSDGLSVEHEHRTGRAERLDKCKACPYKVAYRHACMAMGRSLAEEERMREEHFLFQEPDSTLLLSSGMGRHWPDARGIFANDAKNFLVWTNEEDHTRIISMQMGADIKEVFERFCTAANTVQDVVKKEGYDFMHNNHLGYILVCPSNLGTGLRASVMVKVPLLSARPDFKSILKTMKLQVQIWV